MAGHINFVESKLIQLYKCIHHLIIEVRIKFISSITILYPQFLYPYTSVTSTSSVKLPQVARLC